MPFYWHRECRRVLDLTLKRLSQKELAGKDYMEDYLRDQYRRHLRPHTLGNALKGSEGFMFFIQRRGGPPLTDLFAFGEFTLRLRKKAISVWKLVVEVFL